MINIVTDQLTIRPFKVSEWEDVLTYTSDEKVMKFTSSGIFNADMAKDFVNNNLTNPNVYAIVLNSENKIIGHVIYYATDYDCTNEIGWFINSNYHNKGYGTEAAKALLNHAFTKDKLHRVTATTQPQNYPSIKVMEKIGMRREGVFLKCSKDQNGNWDDDYLYAMLEDEFI